ncbi:hypothetical protein B0H16DRAFT_1662455 [Mycena metata]|uniref:Uncharacterized protein n=1 Tax=Mycena metata TaxID=1033252 RepID=A0AAD7J779_9AGAR|nr:hypothetical protein B0H16DRAFT_1662455 [Mycena metata]
MVVGDATRVWHWDGGECHPPLAGVPPILDSSVDADPNDDGQWLRHENVPGIKKLRESIKFDIDILEKACSLSLCMHAFAHFLSDPASEHEQPISTHAPYLVAVYQELLEHTSSVVSVFKFLQLNPSDGADRRERKGRRPPSTKVDVVADNGRRWIRINTIKNAGILAEFREIDSYLTDSESDSDDPDRRPSLAQTEFDNSILQMGRVLIDAANANPIEGISGPEIPRVTLRLTRLDPFASSDPRIAQTIQCLRDMGVDVELGERPESDIPIPGPLQPTRQINLDLSVLVALVSDLTHSPLPSSERIAAEAPDTIGGLSQDIVKHSRALTTHLLQEMGQGLLQEIHEKLFGGADLVAPKVEFWTSDEARERCMRIVSRIGSDREVRRAEALFPTEDISLSDAEALFWQDSRYPANFIPLLPIRLYPAPPLPPVQGIPEPHSRFFRSMTKPRSEGRRHRRGRGLGTLSTRPAAKTNSRLSPHAVKSMLRGAELGWTTLTTTRSSVKALLREIKAARLMGRLVEEPEDEDSVANDQDSVAAIWVLDARNLSCFV